MRLLFRTQVADVDKFAYRVESSCLAMARSCFMLYLVCCAVLQLSTANAEEVAEHESENIKRVARLMKVSWPLSAIDQSCSAHTTQCLSRSVHRQCALSVPRFVRRRL